MTAREQEAASLRISAARLLDLADQLERPRTVATTRSNTCTCDVCGDQITGLNWIGDPCESTREVTLGGSPYIARCTGIYRLDPEPLTTKTGLSLGITLSALAASQAAQDAAAEWAMDQDLDELSDRSDEALYPVACALTDIAATFTGRRG